MDTILGTFSLVHRLDEEIYTLACFWCGVFLPFKISHRPGWNLNFVQPCRCEPQRRMDKIVFHEIFAPEHHFCGKKNTVTCSQCGIYLLFIMIHQPGFRLTFVQPCCCETKEALRP